MIGGPHSALPPHPRPSPMFYAPGHDAQRPTHPRLHVRDARDAQTVFEAVRSGALAKVTRRLNEVERSMFIQSGAIFVWEESDDEMGLKRWTDGRVWGQSRMREVCPASTVSLRAHLAPAVPLLRRKAPQRLRKRGRPQLQVCLALFPCTC